MPHANLDGLRWLRSPTSDTFVCAGCRESVTGQQASRCPNKVPGKVHVPCETCAPGHLHGGGSS